MFFEKISKTPIRRLAVSLSSCFIIIMSGPRSSSGIDRAHIDSLLASEDFGAHEIAVDQLTTGMDVDTAAATAILMNALEWEVTNPTSYAMALHSYLTITGFIQSHYIRGLLRMGKTAADSLYDRLQDTPAPLKDRFIVALGLMKDPRVHDLLGPLYYKSEDPFVRFKAVEALRDYRDSLDIPVFIDALKDEYYVIMSGYVKDTVTTRDYLIRTAARLALKGFGYQFRYEGNEIIPIPPKKEE